MDDHALMDCSAGLLQQPWQGKGKANGISWRGGVGEACASKAATDRNKIGAAFAFCCGVGKPQLWTGTMKQANVAQD